MKRRIAPGCAVLALCLASAAPALASIVLAMDLQQLVGDANEIVVGRVLSQKARRTDRGQIVTEYTLLVTDSLKGSSRAAERVFVYQPGGVMDGIGMRVAGSPAFVLNRDYLVFAKSTAKTDGPGLMLWPVGMSQGALLIHRDKSGKQMVLPGTGLHTVSPDSRTGLRASDGAVTQPVALSTLLNRVREYIALQRVPSR